MKIYNGFGITPTNNFLSAGADFYIPHVTTDNVEKVRNCVTALSQSYKKDMSEIEATISMFGFLVDPQVFKNEYVNILHLYFGLDSKKIREKQHILDKIRTFVDEYLVFDSKGVPGVKLCMSDSMLINSGIKLALPSKHAGIFLNKSGKGNAGYDVRSQVIDEDYTGYVHLSISYTKDSSNVLYCGDKVLQLLVIPVKHIDKFEEVTEDKYSALMNKSKRGDKGFGSSDVKH